MEWMRIIGDSIQYIEGHLEENVRTEDVAKHVNLSSFYLQKGFAMLCGMTTGEYIRNRKLAKAGQELIEIDRRKTDGVQN